MVTCKKFCYSHSIPSSIIYCTCTVIFFNILDTKMRDINVMVFVRALEVEMLELLYVDSTKRSLVIHSLVSGSTM